MKYLPFFSVFPVVEISLRALKRRRLSSLGGAVVARLENGGKAHTEAVSVAFDLASIRLLACLV